MLPFVRHLKLLIYSGMQMCLSSPGMKVFGAYVILALTRENLSGLRTTKSQTSRHICAV